MTESKEQTNKLDIEEQESLQASLNRRQFIGAGAAAAAALILPKSAQAATGMSNSGIKVALGQTCTAPSLTPPSDTSFYQPNVIYSQPTVGGDYCTLSSNLEIAKEPYPTSGTYIRMFKEVTETKAPFRFEPGPTLCVKPGDKISLNVTNNLDPDTPPPTAGQTNVESTYCLPNQNPKASPPASSVGNTPGCFNTTNLHFHGLHVSPLSIDTSDNPVSSGNVEGDMSQIKESSDDVLYALAPGASNKYCPWLPAFHAPGTHWYHAHHHGSTAIQAAEGLAGALIVKEPPGLEICQGAPDVVMIMQEEPQALTGVTGLTAQENLDRGVYERKGNIKGGKFLINGAQNPILHLKNYEIQRWRFINATSTPRAFSFLQLQDSSNNPVALYRIAVDGITLYGKSMTDPSVQVTQAPFAPGNRVDFLVNLQPGTYTLQKLADAGSAGSSQAQPLATVVVSTAPNEPDQQEQAVIDNFQKLMDSGIPSTGKPAYLNPITTVNTYNQTPVVFQASAGTPTNRVTTAGRGNFRISNSKFDPTNLANVQANLNSSEEWIVANALGGAAHPFHIHVNPFLVVATATIDPTTQGNISNAGQNYQQIHDLLSNLRTNPSDPPGSAWKPTSIATNGIDPTIWWDTFTVPKNTALKIRHRFDDYWGNYVLHCHILLHEDQGMMWAVQINNVNGKGAKPCQQLLAPIVTT